jgi:ParB family transcriptional regulator, chromosome partitioning protein
MYQRNAEWAARDRSGQSPAATTDLDSEASEADREAARLRAEAEQAEAKKRGRRIVVTLNKLGAAATGVRRQFVTTLLARRTLPKGAATFVADCLVRDKLPADPARRTGHRRRTARHRRRRHPQGGQRPARGQRQPRPGDCPGAGVGCTGGSVRQGPWRNPAPVREPGDDRIYYGHQVTSGDLLRFLAANGYTLSAVEEVVTGTRDSEEVYDENLAKTGKE